MTTALDELRKARRELQIAEKDARDWRGLALMFAAFWVITAIGLHWGVCT